MSIQKFQSEHLLKSLQEMKLGIAVGCIASLCANRKGGRINGEVEEHNPIITLVIADPGCGKTQAAKDLCKKEEKRGNRSTIEMILGQEVKFVTFHAQNTTPEELGLNIPTNQPLNSTDLKHLAKMLRAKGIDHWTRAQQEERIKQGLSPLQVIHIDEPSRHNAILSQITAGFVDCNCAGFSPHPSYTMIVFTDNGSTTSGTAEMSSHLINRCVVFSVDTRSPEFQKGIIELKKKLGHDDRSIFRWVNSTSSNVLETVNPAFKTLRSEMNAVAIDHAVRHIKGVQIEKDGNVCHPFAGLPFLDKIRKSGIAGTLGNEAAIQDDMYDIIMDNGLKGFEEFTSIPLASFPNDAVLPSYAYTLTALAECNPDHPKTKVVLDWIKSEVKPNKAELHRELKRKYPELVK